MKLSRHILFLLIAVVMVITLVPTVMADDGEVVILYTNDVHNAYTRDDSSLGYEAVAEYKAELEAAGKNVILVDCGDAIQGSVIGALSKGEYLVDIMSEVGYDLAIPGNHEFDYNMDTFLTLADKASYDYISCNFIDLTTGEPVLDAYKIIEIGGVKVAFIGATTPKTFTSSTPKYFQNEAGEFIYSFSEGGNGEELYAAIQKAVDAAKAENPDYVVLLAHLGVEAECAPYQSIDVIPNITGIDVVLDGHSHSTIEGDIVLDKNGEEVLLTSTGTKLAALGECTLSGGAASSKLVTEIEANEPAAEEFIAGITASFEELVNTVIAKNELTLTINDPATGLRMVRSRETNLGDLCADAYRTLLGADIAFVNGGGVRANLEPGDITYGDIIAVHPFGNMACVARVTGQQVLDALEFAYRYVGEGENGGFQHVSGMTLEIDTTLPSSVVVDEQGMFAGVAGQRRVKNVRIGGKLIDPEETYTLASHNYLLKLAGDGFSMFAGSEILMDEVMVDNEVLITYIVDELGGTIDASAGYENVYGEGRIKILSYYDLLSGQPVMDVAGEEKLQHGTRHFVFNPIRIIPCKPIVPEAPVLR